MEIEKDYEKLVSTVFSLNEKFIQLECYLRKKEYPTYITNLINAGFIDEDGKTVLARSLESVATYMVELKVPLTSTHLERFIKKNGKPYGKSAIRKAIEYAYSPNKK